jgi:hypothetical protein
MTQTTTLNAPQVPGHRLPVRFVIAVVAIVLAVAVAIAVAVATMGSDDATPAPAPAVETDGARAATGPIELCHARVPC